MNTAFKKRLLMLPVAVALLALLGVWASGTSTSTAQAPNQMSIAVDADCDGVVDGGAVGIGNTFCAQTLMDAAPTAYDTYQIEVSWDNAGGVSDLLYVGTANAHLALGAGYNNCAGFTHPGITPAGDDDSYNTNCNRPAGASNFTGPVEQLELKCLSAGVKSLHLVTLGEDGIFGSTTISAGSPIATTLVDGSVTCEAQSNIVTVKSDDTDPVTTNTTFNYTVKATNQGPQPALGLIVGDGLPDIADGDGRGHKNFVNCFVGVDNDGDTNIDNPGGPLPCIPGFIGPFPGFGNSSVATSYFLMCLTFGPVWDPVGCPAGNPITGALQKDDSVVMTIAVQAPSAEAGKPNFNLAGSFLSNNPQLGHPTPTTDPDPANEAECGPLAPGNLGCELTIIEPANVDVDKCADVTGDTVCDANPTQVGGSNINWIQTISVGPGSDAANPYGEGGPPNSSLNCWDNVDNDNDGDIDADGGGAGLPDSECVADFGPIITDDWSESNQSVVSASVDAGLVCLETGTNDMLVDEANDVAPWKPGDQDAICSLSLPVAANNAVTVTVETQVDPAIPGVQNCTNESQAIWGDPASASATATVQCQPPVVNHAIDKGVFVFPNNITAVSPQAVPWLQQLGVSVPVATISLIYGETARVIVAEEIEIVDPGPNPNLLHTWDSTDIAGAGNGISSDWVDVPADAPGDANGAGPTFSDVTDTLGFQTGPHPDPGLITISRELDVKCDPSAVVPSVTVLVFDLTSKAGLSVNYLIVECIPQPTEVKEPNQANLWLMRHPNCVDDDADSKVDEDPVDGVDNDGDGLTDEDFGPCNPYAGMGSILINEVGRGIFVDITSFITQGATGLGAYEKQIKYDHKLLRLKVEDAGFLGTTGRPVNCNLTIVTENWITFGCVTIGQGQAPNNPGPVTLSRIWVTPEADLFNRIRPTKDNGVVTTLLDENCEWADDFGHPLEGMVNGGLVPVCGDAALTIRMLEGDINLDCNVDVLDEQSMAFRYGASFGLLLYNQFYDLEPKLADFDIDIKDLQFVFGRDGSTCGFPIPAQPALPSVP